MAIGSANQPAFESSVVVPATSANLGCAFDCAAVALNLYLKVRAVPAPGSRIEIRYRGPESAAIPLDETNLVAQSFRRAFGESKSHGIGLRLEIENNIPIGVGLGSSAAAIVAGIVLGMRVNGAKPDDARVLQLAAEIEGHPDNVAAACLGGFVVSARGESGEITTARTDVPGFLKFIAVVPNFSMPTKKAREVLPIAYTRADAVYNLQRASLLSSAMFSGRFDLRPELFRDRLHQPYRAELIPGVKECLVFEHPALMGIFLSGAGSAVLAIAKTQAEEIASYLVELFQRHDVESKPLFLTAENRGARDLIVAGAA